MNDEIKQIVDAYAEELENWNFFSDGQRSYIDEKGHIVVCLRGYNWYITKQPVKDIMIAIRALFEIDWIAEYDVCENEQPYISSSKYWDKY